MGARLPFRPLARPAFCQVFGPRHEDASAIATATRRPIRVNHASEIRQDASGGGNDE